MKNKGVTITTLKGEKYVLTFNRKTAAMFNQMGYEADDLRRKPLISIPPFILCAFKANHESVSQKKVNEVWGEVPKTKKPDVLDALITLYSDTYLDLMGADSAGDEDDEGNAATVEINVE